MMRKLLSVAMAGILLTGSAYAQNFNGSMPVDAAAMSAGAKGGTGSDIVDVDLYTGIGSTTIPIYNYHADGLDLGIKLTYNMKGIMVDQLASSIGLGWSMNAGGEITRTVKSMEDEISIHDSGGTSYLYRGAWTGLVGHVTRDNDYDEFNVNLAGRSLEMMLTFADERKMFTFPKSELAIRTVLVDRIDDSHIDDYGVQSFPPGITGLVGDEVSNTRAMAFQVIDEKGNQFFFRPGDIELKPYDIEGSDSTERWVTNRWVISKIVTNGGEEVEFFYQEKYLSYKSAHIEKLTEYFKSPGGINPPTYSTGHQVAYWNGYISQLSRIEYSNGTTAHVYWDSLANVRCDQEGAFVVDSIMIEGRYNNNFKNSITYRFNHYYAHTPTTNNGATTASHRCDCDTLDSWSVTNKYNVRLMLGSIDRVGSDQVTSERYYTFAYHPTALPRRLADEKDFYGYYNKGYTTGNGWPIHVYNNLNGSSDTLGTDRTPDTTSALTYIQAGILKKITNGLGGTVEINYAKPVVNNPSCGYRTGNFYIDFTDGSGKPGCDVDPGLEGQTATDGLIVSSVLIKDGFSDDHDKIIEYNYANGERFFQGGYFWYPTKMEDDFMKVRIYQNHMVSEHRYFRGSNHGYGEVTVVQKNYLTQEQLSKTKYTFSNLILPNPLSDLFTDEYLDSLSANPNGGNFYYHDGNKPTAGLSCLKQKTGPGYHTMPPECMERFMMGLVKTVTQYDRSNNITSHEINKYDLNFLNMDTTLLQRSGPDRKFYFDEVDGNFALVQKNKHIVQDVYYAVGSVEARVRHKKLSRYSGGREAVTQYVYDYDHADNLKRTTWTDSKGDTYCKEKYYTYDYHLYDGYLKSSIQYPLTERTLKIVPGMPAYNRVLSHTTLTPATSVLPNTYHSRMADTFGPGVWYMYGVASGPNQHSNRKYLPKIYFPSLYVSTINEPVTVADATDDEAYALTEANSLASLVRARQNTLYDDRGNLLEVKLNELDRYNSTVWFSKTGHKIAEVNNAKFNEIAFSSFEGLTTKPACTTDYGNWLIDTSAVVYSPSTGTYPKAITGKFIYNLNISSATAALQPNTDYALSFWADVQPLVMLGSTPQTLTQQYILPEWKLYTLEFNSGSETTLSLSDNSILTGVGFIDELRLHPARSSMTTYTYEPLFGISSACDSRNNIIYTEYDEQGRETIVRDIKGYIRAKTETKHQTTNN